MAEAIVHEGEGLTSLPDEVLNRPECRTLKLARNQIKTVPSGVFPRLTSLALLDLSGNKLSGLPADASKCCSLRTLLLSNNRLAVIPECVFSLPNLEKLELNYNKLTDVSGPWFQLSTLKSLHLAYNDLRWLPSDIGWLPLAGLQLEGNARLRMPAGVLAGGFRSVMSYLQVICEQHRLVEAHLDKFAAPATEGEGGGPIKARPSDPAALSALLSRRLGAAAVTGVLDIKYCGTEAALGELKKLQAVYVADVRHNGWRSLGEEVLGLRGLVVLNASDNEIESLAEGITPQALGVLNLSFNALTSLPPALGACPVLQQAYLSGNRLTDLPRSFACAPLVDLFLSENAFAAVPVAVMGMAQLAKLSMACCELREVPDALGGVGSLKFLDLSFNQLHSLPSGLSRLTALNALNLSFNPLDAFPPVITTITSLLELNLDYTGVSSVPEGLGELRRLEGLQLEGCRLPLAAATLYAANPLLLVQVHNTALTSLDLSGLGLQQIPPLARLQRLTALDLSRNRLARPPPDLVALPALAQLSLRGNPLEAPWDLVREARGDLELVNLLNPNAEKLDLSGCGLETLLPELAPHAGSLQQLKLSSNAFSSDPASLPPWLASFARLSTLVLDRNRLAGPLPGVLGRLPALSILMASHNQVSELPEELISNWGKLQALVLQSNLLTELPSSISRLTGLKALVLPGNRLTRLPDALCACTGLRLLDLCYNGLGGLPAGMGALCRLKALKLSHNGLPSVPRGLSCLTALTELRLAHNPLPLQGMELNAMSGPAVRVMLSALLDACAALPAAAHAAEVEAAAAALAAAAAAAAPKPAPGEEGGDAGGDAGEGEGEVDAAEAEAVALVADVAALQDEEEARGTAPAPPGPAVGEIKTAEDPEAIRKRVEMLQEELRALHPDSRAATLARHAETLARDPLRPKPDAWQNVPIMNIPRIIAAISSPPPPPPPGADGTPGAPPAGVDAEGRPLRPQVMHRFKRVVDQSAMAMQLLNRVEGVLQAGQQANAAAAAAAAPPPALMMSGMLPPGMTMTPPGMGMGMGMAPPMMMPPMGMPPGMPMLPPGMMPPGMVMPPGFMGAPGMPQPPGR